MGTGTSSGKGHSPPDLVGGTHDAELTDDIRDYHIPQATRDRLEEIESLRTYGQFEEYFAARGIELDTKLDALKGDHRDVEHEHVNDLLRKIAVGVDAYKEYFGPNALSKLKRVVLYDNDLNTNAAYSFNRIGESDPNAGTISFRNWSADGRMVFHELAHAYQDSRARSGEDAITASNRMAAKAGMPSSFKTYLGAPQEAQSAEKMADAFSYAFTSGNKERVDFMRRVARG